MEDRKYLKLAIEQARKSVEQGGFPAGIVNLSGAILYASLQPCLMCFSVANWAGIEKIVFGCRKTKEMVKKGYYEGESDIYAINEKNNRKIELVYLPDFERETLDLINKWESKLEGGE